MDRAAAAMSSPPPPVAAATEGAGSRSSTMRRAGPCSRGTTRSLVSARSPSGSPPPPHAPSPPPVAPPRAAPLPPPPLLPPPSRSPVYRAFANAMYAPRPREEAAPEAEAPPCKCRSSAGSAPTEPSPSSAPSGPVAATFPSPRLLLLLLLLLPPMPLELAAQWRGPRPSSSPSDRHAPDASNELAVAADPRWQARASGVHEAWQSALTSAPASRSTAVSRSSPPCVAMCSGVCGEGGGGIDGETLSARSTTGLHGSNK